MSTTKLYDDVSYDIARLLTLRYSSSFGLASKLFARSVRPHIYAIYGMVRAADEIVDTYDGPDRATQLGAFRSEIAACLTSNYSANPLVHAYCIAARRFDIGTDLSDPFFDSMAMDLTKTTFTKAEYDTYVYGSAEVVGLMCLKVFYGDDTIGYEAAVPGARALGSAYQKVNFLRDIAADASERGRFYFPGITNETWDNEAKASVVSEIKAEFETARRAIKHLPAGARTGVYASYLYYTALLSKLNRMSASQIIERRAHVPFITKLLLLFIAPIGARL